MSSTKFYVIDDGAETGVREEFAFDVENGQAVNRTTYTPKTDTNAILSSNREFNNNHDGYTPSRELQHVASIPMSVVMLWIEKYGVDPTARGNEALLMRLLNSNEWSDLRTGSGTLVFKNR